MEEMNTTARRFVGWNLQLVEIKACDLNDASKLHVSPTVSVLDNPNTD